MNYKKAALSNGIRFIHSPVKSLESATFTIWYGVGSRYENENKAGISHFLEHMAFKGGKKYKTAKEVSEGLDAIGADNNAATSQEYTNYYVRSAVEKLPEAIDVLADSLLTPALDEREIERERGVIIEEINMYEDDPQSSVNNLYGELIFQNHPLGRDIAGSKITVSSFKREDFQAFRKAHYLPQNMVITVSGGIEYNQAFNLAEKYFGQIKSEEYSDNYQNFNDLQTAPRVALKFKKTEQANLIIGFPGNKFGLPSRYAEGLMGIILGSGMSSRLFREVRERRGLAYTVYANSSHYADTGEFSAFAGVPLAKTKEAIKVILDEFYKLTTSKHALTKKELDKAKAFFKGHMALSLESTKAINYFLGRDEIKGGKLRTIDEVFEKIEEVQIHDILDVAQDIFVSQRANLAIVGPYEKRHEFEKLLQ